jgi:allantoin racemase
MNLLYYVPGSLSKTPGGRQELERRHALLQQIAGPAIQVAIEDYPDGPRSIESIAEEYLAVPGVLHAAARARSAGHDAMIIGCYSDPGLAAAREVADVLVVGPAEASLLFALAIGRKPAIVTTLRSTIPSMEDLVQRLALRDRVACVRAVDVPVLDLRREGARVRDELNREARLAQEAGADSIIPGCMTLAFMDLEEDYGREWDLPLVNPVRAAVWLAFGLWSGGFRHSRVAFSTPRKLQEIIG